jgi:hypothetical protein
MGILWPNPKSEWGKDHGSCLHIQVRDKILLLRYACAFVWIVSRAASLETWRENIHFHPAAHRIRIGNQGGFRLRENVINPGICRKLGLCIRLWGNLGRTVA